MRYFFGISLLTSVLLICRLCLKNKVSKKLQYSLWLLIPIYMLMAPIISIPVMIVPHISSEVNKQTITEHTPAEVVPYIRDISDYSSEPNINYLASSEETYIEYNSDTNNIPEIENAQKAFSFSKLIASIDINVLIKAANSISLVFILILLIYNLSFALYCKNKRSFIEKDASTGLNVFKLNFKGTPFLLGKDIYLNDFALIERNKKYAIYHEFCHYKHGDQFWSVVRYLVLAVNWYNPLIWAAFVASEQDAEYACDEEVVKLIGDSKRIEYGKVLLSFLSDSSSLKRDFSISTAMNGRNKRYMKERITNIKKDRSISVVAIILSLTVALLAVGCSLVDVKETATTTNEDESELAQTIDWESVDKTVWANIHGLQLRSQPDPNASVVAILRDGTLLNVIEESTDWYHIQTSSGIDGYTRIIFTTNNEPDSPTATSEQSINAENYDATVITENGILEVPQIGLLPDGVYTCIMSSVNCQYMGQDTCVFVLWNQEYITDEALNELQIGDNFTGNSSVFFDNAFVTCLIPSEISPYFLYGTHYTGEILTVTEEGPNGGAYYFAKSESGVWYLFYGDDNPVTNINSGSVNYGDYVRLPIAEDAHIYDGYTPFLFDDVLPEDITDEEQNDIIDFTNTSYDFSNPESIAEFFTRVMDGTCSYNYSVSNFNAATHENTVIEVVDNEIVNIWFWL